MSAAANGDGHVQSIRLTIPAKPEYITLGRLALTGIARLRARPLPQETVLENFVDATEPEQYFGYGARAREALQQMLGR